MKVWAAARLKEKNAVLRKAGRKIMTAAIWVASAVMLANMMLAGMLLAGCAVREANGGNPANVPEGSAPGTANPGGSVTANDPREGIDLSLKPNEAGKIMVLMYHNIGSEEKEWVRTPANFRKDLTVLYEKKYRPLSLQDYVTGNITTEQGYTPVVLTFDDGNQNNFRYLDDGTVDGDSAVGILLDFHAQHPDFPLKATFFINGRRPFGQKGLESRKLAFILEKGMEIGNHTRDHPSLKEAAAGEIQEQIGSQAQFLEMLLSGSNYSDYSDYKINALALPYGEKPLDEALWPYLVEGNHQGVPYHNTAVLKVGWNPGYSPYDTRFDCLSVPRVRASEIKVAKVGLYDYLAYFDQHPAERFISDGVPEIITVPEDRKEFIGTFEDKEIYVYDTE